LRALGIALARLPGEYRINFRNGSGRDRADSRECGRSARPWPRYSGRHAGPAYEAEGDNRRLRIKQLGCMRARALKKQREDG
jgi:hypothetical protein